MQCDVCKTKKATVFLTQMLKGEMQKVNLCASCAKEKGVTDPTGFALADVLLGLGTTTPSGTPKEKTCPFCKLPQGVFRKTGRLGCSHCYVTFADGLEHLLKAMHKGTQHVGKSPYGTPTPPPPVQRLSELEDALQAAVRSEDFEQAARLRDEINRLTGRVAARQ